MALIVRAPRLEFSLLENAYDSFAEGLARFERQMCPGDLKHAIIHTAQAVELFLKARLYKEHRLLVFADPGAASNDSPTVDIDRALLRLQAAGVVTLPRDAGDIAAIRKLRNRLLHYAISIPQGDAEAAIGRAVAFLERFLLAEFAVRLEDHVPATALFMARKAALGYEGALRLGEKQLADRLAQLPEDGRDRYRILDCPDCGQAMILYPNPDGIPRNAVRCYFCDSRHQIRRCGYCGWPDANTSGCAHCVQSEICGA